MCQMLLKRQLIKFLSIYLQFSTIVEPHYFEFLGETKKKLISWESRLPKENERNANPRVMGLSSK